MLDFYMQLVGQVMNFWRLSKFGGIHNDNCQKYELRQKFVLNEIGGERKWFYKGMNIGMK